MTNCCGQRPRLFVTSSYPELGAARSLRVFGTYIQYMNVQCSLFMIIECCGLFVFYFLLVALMTCYLSAPVFKCFSMGVHMSHPALSATCAEVFICVVFILVLSASR